MSWSAPYGYTGNGHLGSLTYPSGALVDYAPNALGQPSKAGSHATGVSYFPNGAIKQFTYGNGIVHTMTQNARQLPAKSCDAYGSCGTAAVLNDSYAYDPNGNVTGITDGRSGGRSTRTLTYDNLDRPKTAVSPMFGSASYSYDVLDNLTRVQVGATPNLAARDHYYCYDATWQLTNIKTGSCGGASVVGLSYDSQGNLNNRNGVQHTFDYGNRLRLVQYAGTWVESYRYDVHGRRVRSWNGSGTLRSMYANNGQLLFQKNERTGKAIDYILLAGSIVAQVETPVAGGAATVTYQHTDALGSPVASTNAARAIVESSEYEPFGRVGNRAMRDGVGYTGHAEDMATGLNYMQQRYYDPQIGRFLSVDPVTAYGNPVGAFNRYWYANNNPYRFTDPDGRQSWSKVVDMMLGRPVESSEKNRPIDTAAAEIIGNETKGLRQAAAQYEKGQQVMGRVMEERVSVNAKFSASAGTGIQGNKSIAGNSSDTLGWVPVGEGAYAGLTVDVNFLSVRLFEANSPSAFDVGGDVGAVGSVGGSLSINPAGQLNATVSFGVGIGEHMKYTPTMNYEIKKVGN